MKKELLFVIIAAICVFAIAVFMIGGVLQDVDYHDLSKLPLTEQQDEYGRMQSRKSAGEKIQLVSAILIFISFLGIMITSLTFATQNDEKRALKAEQAKARR